MPADGGHSSSAQPGHYWKTPFFWEPGCPLPPFEAKLRFESTPDERLRPAISAAMASSLDESDRFTIQKIGIDAAVQELYELLPQYFDRDASWWRVAKDPEGRTVGFVLPVTFKEQRFWRDGQPQGTIFYMGVLPGFRGHRYGLELVREATRLFVRANCWRTFCDTGSTNAPMLDAFRQAGYMERAPWQRPLM